MKNALPAAATGFAVLLAAAPDAECSAAQRPDIVWIMAEDISLDLACYGMPAVRTPNLDRLYSEGIVYTNARCATPISSPSRSAMLTGVHSTRFDANNHRSNRDKPLPEDIKPLTCHLREAGYSCVLGHPDIFRPSYSKKNSQSAYKIDGNFKWTETGTYDGVENFGIFDCFDTLPDKGRFFNQITLFVTHRGDWWKEIRAQSDSPVDPAAVALPPFMADHPKIREEFACYLDQVEYMDREVGKILDDLRKCGRIDNTIVIFIGDNGRADLRGKGFLYDAGTRVPMIIWGKGIRHEVVDEVATTLDLTATVLQLAGCRIPEAMESRPLLDNRRRPIRTREYTYASRDTWDEVPECIRSINTDDYTYIRNYFPEYPYDRPQVYLDFHRPALHIMRRMKAEGRLSGAQMLFFTDTKPVEELYDTRRDPDNLRNLADDPAFAETLAQMRAMLAERLAAYRDTGIEDRRERERTTRPAKRNVRDYMQQMRPQDWEQKVLSGEIVTEYHIWSSETRKAKKEKRF